MKKTIRLTESDIRKMVVRALNEALGEGDFDDIEGLEPDPEEKRAQMDSDWNDYHNPGRVEKRYSTGTPYYSEHDDTGALTNQNIGNNGLNGYYGLHAQGYDKFTPNHNISVGDRMFAQEKGSSTRDSVRKGHNNWAADIDTLSDFGDIDSDGNSVIIGMSGANNGKIANRGHYFGNYNSGYSLDEAVTRAIRKYIK